MKREKLLKTPLLPISGIRVGAVSAGIKKPGRLDLVLFELAKGTNTAAVFTQNIFCAAPVSLAKAHLQSESPSALIVNTGYANAGMGKKGLKDASQVCEYLANQKQIPLSSILPFSTGVIGEPLPVERIAAAIPQLLGALSEDGWDKAAEGILTTDTEAKGLSLESELNGKKVCITGIAKGAGMIKPNMATLLAFVATDAEIAEPLLKQMLADAIEESFHAISVDGDTSTNDSVVMMATGKAGVAIEAASSDKKLFQDMLNQVFQTLAQSIVKDAEGATKFIEIEVKGAVSKAMAKEVAFKVAHSPLVKTACFASDPNWGRILSAVGNAEVEALNIDKVSININQIKIVSAGMRVEGYDELSVANEMQKPDIQIQIDLGLGSVVSRVWTSDLSYDYVKINAEYRT